MTDLTKLADALEGEKPQPSYADLQARVIELEKALSAMLTHMGMDEDEWNKPTFDQARAALRKGHYGDAKTST